MSHLSFYQLFCILRHHRRISERRDAIFESNKTAKWLLGFMMTFMVLYLLMFAVMLSLGANASSRYTAVEFIMGASPIIIMLDFWGRFVVQHTPVQLIRPYILLPIPRFVCIDTFLINSLLSWGNLLWFVLLVPFCLMSVIFGYGPFPALSLLLLYYLLFLADSQWYSIARTLIISHPLWWLLPMGVTALIALPLLLGNWASFFRFYAHTGTGLEHGNIIPHVVVLALLTTLFMINRRLQYQQVWKELGRQQTSTLKHVSRFSFLEHFDVLGEYIKIEIKSLLRNRNPRKSFLIATAVVIFISFIIVLTDVYDTATMTNFWCFYNFAIFGVVLLIKIMGYEGNYMDLLMIHHEELLKLLTAKYYFFCSLLLLPFVLMLPMVFVGKWSILMLLSYAAFTAGFQYCLLMQAAVYNNKSIPMNENFVGKGGIETNYIQIIGEILAFLVPMVIISVLELVVSPVYAWLVMMAIGLGFISTHRWWLRSIYRRMMLRRYANLESFRK